MLCILGEPGGCLGPSSAEKRLLDVDTQVILGLLSGRDRSFSTALQGWVVVPEPAAGQLVVCAPRSAISDIEVRQRRIGRFCGALSLGRAGTLDPGCLDSHLNLATSQ